jgi:hypothetical protein
MEMGEQGVDSQPGGAPCRRHGRRRRSCCRLALPARPENSRAAELLRYLGRDPEWAAGR